MPTMLILLLSPECQGHQGRFVLLCKANLLDSFFLAKSDWLNASSNIKLGIIFYPDLVSLLMNIVSCSVSHDPRKMTDVKVFAFAGLRVFGRDIRTVK